MVINQNNEQNSSEKVSESTKVEGKKNSRRKIGNKNINQETASTPTAEHRSQNITVNFIIITGIIGNNNNIILIIKILLII